MDPIVENKKTGSKGVIASVVALLLVTGGIFVTFKNSSNNSNQIFTVPTDTANNTPTNTSPTTTPAITNSKYKDGTYSTKGDYQSPGGSESIQVTLVLKNNVITDATVIPNSSTEQSISFQEVFSSNFKQYVVGKNIDEVNLTKVSGSSLTPNGFNDAVAKIKIQAQA